MTSTQSSAAAALRCLVLGALAGAIAFHAVMSLLFTLPTTPLTVQYAPLINAYISPYFAQNWSFFAPNPPTEDDYVVAQYEVWTHAGRRGFTQWINLSKTYNEAVIRDRLSPLEIVQLTISNAYGDVTRSSLFSDGKLIPRSDIVAEDPATRPPALHTLERLAMAYFPRSGINGRLIAVRIGLYHHEFPRWSHRDAPDDLRANNSILMFPFTPREQVAPL